MEEPIDNRDAPSGNRALEEHLKSRSTWLRLFFMIVLGFFYAVSRVVTVVVIRRSPRLAFLKTNSRVPIATSTSRGVSPTRVPSIQISASGRGPETIEGSASRKESE